MLQQYRKIATILHRLMFGVQRRTKQKPKKKRETFWCKKTKDLVMASRKMLLTEISGTINFSTYEREPHFNQRCLYLQLYYFKRDFLAHSLIHSLTFVTSDFPIHCIWIRSQHSKVYTILRQPAACWEFIIKRNLYTNHMGAWIPVLWKLILWVIKLFNYIDSLWTSIEFPCTSCI